MNKIVERRSSQHIGDFNPAAEARNQKSIDTVHPNGSTYNQSDMTPNITPRLDQGRNTEGQNYKDS
jgi:hypothetical protein